MRTINENSTFRLNLLLHLTRDLIQKMPLFKYCSPVLRNILLRGLHPEKGGVQPHKERIPRIQGSAKENVLGENGKGGQPLVEGGDALGGRSKIGLEQSG
jgi:hypothetical protein